MKTQGDLGIVLISEGAYRLLLQLYPRRFRDELGLDMSRTFRDHSREQYQRDGLPGLIGLWMFTTFDVVRTALEEWVRTGEWFMSKETLIRIGGPAMILGGVVWFIANLGHMPTEYFGGIDFDPVWNFAFPPVLIGLYALTAYAGANYPLRAAAWTALISGAIAYLGVLGRVAVVFMLGVLVMVLAIMFFGHIARGEKPLPRWNGAGLFMLASFAALFISPILGSAFARSASSDIFSNIALTTIFGLVGVCWVLLGIAMLPPKRQTAPAVQL